MKSVEPIRDKKDRCREGHFGFREKVGKRKFGAFFRSGLNTAYRISIWDS